MKKLFCALLFAGLSACQPEPVRQQTRQAVKKPVAANDWGTAADTLPPPIVPVWQGNVVRNDLKSIPITEQEEIKRFFQQYKLAAILQATADGKREYAFNGFRGSNKYRTEVVVLQARQDAHNPAAYYLAGLGRTKRKVTPFEGKVIFERLSHEPLLTADDQKHIKSYSMVVPILYPGNEPAARYAVGGNVKLWEKDKRTLSSTFTGTVIIELALTEAGRMRLDSPFLHGPSQGGALKYEGVWASAKGLPGQPAVWVDDIVGYSPNIFKDLAMGERDVAVNPTYAKLGWNTFWENDEWWVDSPAPQLSL